MLKTSLLLFFEFFKVGLFTFGGGYASLPFLYRISEVYHWFSNTELTQMIAISGLTPGPIGFNMSTFAGFKTLGILGAVIAGLGLVFPMIIITTQVFRLYRKFCENEYVKSILYVLRPTSCALISFVALKLIYSMVFNGHFSINFIDFKALFILVVLFALTFKFSRNPIYYMLVGAAISLIFYFVKL